MLQSLFFISTLKQYLLKIYALFVNKLFIYKSYLFDLISPSSIKNILYSEKEWWDQLLQKGPLASRFNMTFSKLENCNFYNYDVVVPLTISDLEICIDRKKQMANSVIPVPSHESFAICNDKRLFNDFMLSHNFSDYVPGELMVEQFPFMLKKIMDEGGENTFVVKNMHDMEKYKEQYDSLDYFTQNIIPGKKEYATHILIKDGKIVNALTIVYLFKTNSYVKGKDHYICRMVTRNKHLDLFENILESMQYNGLCCVNYKEQNGVPKIFEINPRFGGSLCEFFYPFIRKIA
jgi:carbamoylphosphate synthase large subunit